MEVFNKDVIEKFTERCPDEVVERVLAVSTGLLSKCIDELKLVTPALAGDYNYVLVDDHYYDSSTVNSELTLFVVFKSPQLELNTYNLVNNKFKQFATRLKYAWQSTKKPKKKKRKKDKEQTNDKSTETISVNKYTISNLKQDLANKIVQQIDPESYIQFTKYGLKLVSKKELGLVVNIYPVIENNKSYKIYNSIKNTFYTVEFKNREINFNKKLKSAGENFVYMIRVFNNLFYTIYNYYPNQILIESIMYNIPDSLFKGYKFYESFIKILNYLNNAYLKNFVSIVDENKSIFDETLIVENVSGIINGLIKNIEKNL